MPELIDKFIGKYRFLSNFYAVRIQYEDLEYPSVEHAFQAAKSLSNVTRMKIAQCATAGEAKRKGRAIVLRNDWETVKEEIMLDLLRLKFDQWIFQSALLQTFPAKLIEGNDWGDRYWGVCRGEGKNRLGELLMQVRSELRESVNEAVQLH